ncbi:IclR family transcriptional regulator [Rhizobium helianthi]|uniref:IclR family transcriptional regulator n=1 Tax=Rhizobium helianthi TaxID=1132695 RepID=A0ABW4M361_9HYPH
MAQEKQDTGTLGKAVQLIDLVSRCDEPVRFTDLLKMTGQPRGSLHRQLRHLLAEGLLDQNKDGAFSPGLRLLAFASRAWARSSVRQLAERHMLALHEATGETVHLGMLRGTEIIYLDKLESKQAVRMHSQVGNTSPVYCTGIGKAALSCLSESELHSRLDQLMINKFTPHTLVDKSSLKRQLEAAKQEGCAFDLEEHQVGIRCVAAPIHVPDQDFLGGISVTAPAFRTDLEQLSLWAPAVKEAAQDIVADILSGLGPSR